MTLKALGNNTKYKNFNKPDWKILDKFPSMLEKDACVHVGTMLGVIKITCPEFTSLCPKTGQPDFATIIIEYRPRDLCVESKSLKLYLMSYRMHGAFHESCVNQILNDLVRALDPWWVVVEGQFTPRGGIPFWPRVRWQRYDYVDSIQIPLNLRFP